MDKLNQLHQLLQSYGKVAIAYSGGCDSHFLLSQAIQCLGKENVLAIIALGDMMSKEDKEQAQQLLKDVNHEIIDVDVLNILEFKYNHKKRCYYCKKAIMSKVKDVALKHGFEYVVDGQNEDDQGVYRPGIQACHELGILSPMALVHLTKQEIRDYSYQQGIPTHNKPANACLASRFDYGEELTLEKLQLVDKAESYFHKQGIDNVRVRVHQKIARIEVEPQYFNQVIENKELINEIKSLGFQFITLDLQGLRSGGYDHEHTRDTQESSK